MVRLDGSVNELNAALAHLPLLQEENSTEVARAAVSLLRCDTLTQLLTFSPTPSALTLRALSPRARLYAELHARPCHDSRAVGCISVQRGRLTYSVTALWNTGSLVGLRLAMWWAEGCGLPLALEVDNTCSEALQTLRVHLRERVTRLHLHITTVTICSSTASTVYGTLPEDSVVEGGSGSHCVCTRCPTTVADLLPSLSRLDSLFIDCYCDIPTGLRAAAVVAHVLRSAAAPPMALQDLELSRCTFVSQPLRLAGLRHLRRLEILRCEVRHLRNAGDCTALEEVEVNFCDRLPSLAELTTAPHLHKVTAFLCGLRSLEGLAACQSLTALDVSHNPTLTSLTSLQAGGTCAQRLRWFKAMKCKLRSLEGVHLCPHLTHLDVSFNNPLQSLAGLAGAAALQSLKAVHCGLRSVEGLQHCPALLEVNLSRNQALDSLSGLAGAPELERVMAVGCNLRDLAGLESCPMLANVDVSNNHRLRSLSALSGLRGLQKLRAAVCSVQSVEGLGSCPRLTELDASFNVGLISVEELIAAPRLRLLDVHDTGVGDISVLRGCRALVKVDASHCDSLQMDFNLPTVEVIVSDGVSVYGGKE